MRPITYVVFAVAAFVSNTSAHSWTTPTCRAGSYYCGKGLVVRGYTVKDLEDALDRAHAPPVDDVQESLFLCTLSNNIEAAEDCEGECVDGGTGNNDYCANPDYYTAVRGCTEGRVYCGKTLLAKGYDLQGLQSLLDKENEPRQVKPQDQLFRCEGSPNLVYEKPCYPFQCLDRREDGDGLCMKSAKFGKGPEENCEMSTLPHTQHVLGGPGMDHAIPVRQKKHESVKGAVEVLKGALQDKKVKKTHGYKSPHEALTVVIEVLGL